MTIAPEACIPTDVTSESNLAPCAGAPPALELVWVCGPDAGGSVPLADGAHLIGRARTAGVNAADPDLELHHAELVVREGSIGVSQLSGRRPITTGTFRVPARIDIGGSVLVVREAEAVGTRPLSVDPAAPLPFVRSPRAVPADDGSRIEVPRSAMPPGRVGGGLLPTLLGVAAAGVLALFLHQVMFLLFGLMGASVAVATWAAQRVGFVRSRSSVAGANRRAQDAFVETLMHRREAARSMHIATTPTLERAVATMLGRTSSLWAVRAGETGAFRASIGEGEVFWRPPIDGVGNASAEAVAAIDAATGLGVLPIAVDLTDGVVLAIVGAEDARAVARALVLQLAARLGPADLRVALVGGDDPWPELSGLALVDDEGSLTNTVDGCDARHLVVVLDGPAPLNSRTSALRRVLGGDACSAACIVVCATEADVPAMTTSTLVIGRAGTARWMRDTRVAALAESARIAGVSARRAVECVSAIAGLIDPEHVDDAALLPREVDLLDLLRERLQTAAADGAPRTVDALAAAIAAGWRHVGDDPAPRAPLGRAAGGGVDIDLVADGPHGLLAGTTGAGKSELLRSLVVALAVVSSPEHISFVLVDFKGGSTFDGCADLPHVVGVVTDLDGRLAERALRSLDAELGRRERLLRQAGASDISTYRARRSSDASLPALPRLVVVIDEFAHLAVQLPDLLVALLGIAQRGRSLGVHLLLATQRPGGVVNDDIRANTNLRVALRVQDTSDAVDVIGDAKAASLPRSVPGRAMMRLGADDVVTFQTARCAPADLTMIVSAVRLANAACALDAPHRTWLPPLPATWRSVDGALGLIDDVEHQTTRPLGWADGDGHLLLAGSIGCGTTTAPLTIAAAAVADGREMYVVDALGDAQFAALDVAGACRAFVRLHERERLMRLLGHLHGVIAARRAPVDASDTFAASGRADVIVLIDGMPTLRADLESDERWDQLAALDLLVTEGAAAGVRIAMTAPRPGAVPSRPLAAVAQRWIFHLDDPLDAAVVGIPGRRVPERIPGRVIDARSGCDAQVATLAPRGDPSQTIAPAASPAIAELPAAVDPSLLPPPWGTDGDVHLPIGLGFEALDTVSLCLRSGEHALVIGPARSGRTTTLETIAESWRTANHDGWVGSIAPRRTSARPGERFEDVATLLAAAPADRPVLVVIDDAELVDDATGALARCIAGRGEGFTVVAAGRAEALRAAYGHWTTTVRRCRLGIVMAAASDLDADLLGALLPRRLPIAARPGLAWIIADGEHHLVQIAGRTDHDDLRLALGASVVPRRTAIGA